jgi:hypothetical protein
VFLGRVESSPDERVRFSASGDAIVIFGRETTRVIPSPRAGLAAIACTLAAPHHDTSLASFCRKPLSGQHWTEAFLVPRHVIDHRMMPF